MLPNPGARREPGEADARFERIAFRCRRPSPLATLMWRSRTLDPAPPGEDDVKAKRRAAWQRGLVTLRGEVLGTEQALTAIEGRYYPATPRWP